MSRVLLVENNVDDAKKLTALLSNIHYRYRIVDTREKAEEWIALEEFDSIITDAQLKDGSYRDILHYIL